MYEGERAVENDPDKTITDSSVEFPEGVKGSTPEINQSDSCGDHFDSDKSDEGEKEEETRYNQGRWTYEEHFRFIDGILLYGNNWKKVQKHIGSRSPIQARSHAQKFFIRIKKVVFDNRTTAKPVSKEYIVSQLKLFIKHEILNKITMQQDGAKKYASLLDGKDRLCKVLLLLIANFSKGKISKSKLQSLDHEIEDIDYLLKNEDIPLMEKTFNKKTPVTSLKAKETVTIKPIVKIFSITKTVRKASLDQMSIGRTNDNSVTNLHIINNSQHSQASPSTNNYINIVTINVCNNDKEMNVPYSNEMGFLTNKTLKTMMPDTKGLFDKPKDDFITKPTLTNPYSVYNNIYNNDDFIVRNNPNPPFDDADEIINSFFVNNKQEDKDFDMDSFFTK
jgi:SHAQKYF class myb-like DNA-binding protein